MTPDTRRPLIETVAEITRQLADEAARHTAAGVRNRREFWQHLEADDDKDGHTLYSHEALAFAATSALVRTGLLDRAIIFDRDGLGFMDLFETIADAIAKTLPTVDWVELEYVHLGKPADEPQPPAE